jgi:hypothetical protein
MSEYTLASESEFRNWLATTSYSSSWTGDAVTIRRLLEESTREILAYCGDSGTFGPISATVDYDLGDGLLYDDPRPLLWNGQRASRSRFPWIISVTSAKSYSGTDRATSNALTEDTDYFLTPYQTIGFSAPYLGIKYKDAGTNTNPFESVGMKVLEIVGEFGWADTKTTDTTLSGAVGTTSTKSVSVTSAANLSAGQTILINSERMYIESISGTTLTVERAVAGSTAATHSSSDQIYFYTYPAAVTQACLDLTRLSWIDRTGGLQDDINVGAATISMVQDERKTVLHGIDSYATHTANVGVTF